MESPTKTTGIGTKEQASLKPGTCEVVNTDIEEVGDKKARKAVFFVKHPDKQEPVKMSSVVVMRKRKDKKEILTLGTWANLDEDGLIQKDSPLAMLLTHYGAKNLTEMINKKVETEQGNDNFLAIKAY